MEIEYSQGIQEKKQKNKKKHETKTLIRKPERILNKLYKQNLSLLFNETYIYICVCMCVCVCVCV